MNQVCPIFRTYLAKNCKIDKCGYHTHTELRKSFLDFFASKNHDIVKSSSVIPAESDGTLLFTNAGMNQFKPQILSSTKPQRVANIQKCIRAGGKHNDLDDVGRDLHHQTFFEMMGNWSFNDAFSKEEACRFAWEYLTSTLRICPSRLYVSYFSGNSSLGLPEDVETREIWKKIGISPERILPFQAENFWEMGNVGPCGPCTEIHFDRIGNRDASLLVNHDDSVVEIWNLVFMSFLRDSEGVRSLGKNHVDTGMGFERLLSVVQGKSSNFDTDVFAPLMEKISELTPSRLCYTGSLTSREDSAFRVISDHIRASTIAISDGAQPDGTGAGFIVRKMLRRAFLQANSRLHLDRFALPELVPTVIESLGGVYQELNESQEQIRKIIKSEEEQFWRTVDRGIVHFDRVNAENRQKSTISGKAAFNLFETHGLPLEITVELARNIGKTVDEREFEKCQVEAQELSRKASQFKFPVSLAGYPTHSDRAKYEYRVENGQYVFPSTSTKILAIFQDLGKVEKLTANQKGHIVLENCQFYAEQGGQASDNGALVIDEQQVFHVESAKKVGGVTIFSGISLQNLEVGQEIQQCLDEKRRVGVMRAHSATHLLNWLLQKNGVGGGQKGSSVECDRLRFDYATTAIFEKSEKTRRLDMLAQCQQEMRAFIEKGAESVVTETSLEEAKRMENLQADVKEQRISEGETIRIVSFGEADDAPKECCSGTHVRNSAHIGDVAILSDKSIGTKVRRITVVTGNEAKKCREYVEHVERELNSREGKERAIFGKKINWKMVPISEQSRISELIKMKKK